MKFSTKLAGRLSGAPAVRGALAVAVFGLGALGSVQAATLAAPPFEAAFVAGAGAVTALVRRGPH